jgi:hypothetical protein
VKLSSSREERRALERLKLERVQAAYQREVAERQRREEDRLVARA